MTAAALEVRGAEMFARYAYAPNALGYCGPPLAATLRDGSVAQIRAAARKFAGAWPYLQVLSKMTGIADPLDHRLVESYWLGGGLGAHLDPVQFVDELLAIIGPQAGHYWSHLGPDLVREAAANHCFHVFGIYPWSRLLGRGVDEHPLSVLDNCRITWGTVLSRDSDDVEVSCRVLAWDGHRLDLSEPVPRRLDVWADGYCAVPDVAVGDEVAIHWGRMCGRLRGGQIEALADSTMRQLRVTNQRLARV
ncbi:hypothetical protein JMUB5695_03373 [Mycobacterium heckeshornense]|uniref:DUF6390 family protein n=1 Tax=Mycobacterium heckeshornense TaxID=110505 RepID=UPI0019421627|nr:DUF6390 family protein [Mycobacterium heckeshornense]BCQ09921.1 hypothetical protein JMUB5695_03373 [Mycobacterium heckeshornense]